LTIQSANPSAHRFTAYQALGLWVLFVIAGVVSFPVSLAMEMRDGDPVDWAKVGIIACCYAGIGFLAHRITGDRWLVPLAILGTACFVAIGFYPVLVAGYRSTAYSGVAEVAPFDLEDSISTLAYALALIAWPASAALGGAVISSMTARR
jgi:hypothetical protein